MFTRNHTLLFLGLFLLSCSDNNDLVDPDPDNGILPGGFVMGVDLSYVNQVEDQGGVYREHGAEVDPFEVLGRHGADMVRLRLWHNPDWIVDLYPHEVPLYSGFEDVKKSIMRARQHGMEVLLDFHYSDVWADPGRQHVPEAWSHITEINILADSVYNYTFKVLHDLYEANLKPEMVQIGNETNCGMMTTNTTSGFPLLNVCQGHWQNFGIVVNAAIRAVRDVDALSAKHTRVALHVADPKNLQWWLHDVINKANVVDFEIMGFSYYHIWHNTVSFNSIPGLIRQLRETYNRDFMVLETAYPFTTANNDNYPNIFHNQPPLDGFPYTVEGQRNFLIAFSQNMIDAGAAGLFYWEPAWITSNLTDLWGTGSSWDNCTFFNFSGNLTEVVEYFTWEYDSGNQ